MDLALFWLYLELFGWLGRRRRARRSAIEVPPTLPTAAARGCACSFCSSVRAA